MRNHDHVVNAELIKTARAMFGGRVKQAFVPGGDPSQGGGGGDPSQGGAPPGGPPPGDPSQGGGPPPGGGGGGMDPAMIQQLVNQAVQQAMQSQGGAGGAGGAAGAGGAGLKPKIDVNVEIMQIKNMLAKICDQLGVQIPAQDMVATPDKLMQMAQGQNTATPAPQGGGGAIGGVDPMQGMQPAGAPGGDPTKQGSYRTDGSAFDSSGLSDTVDKASAISRMRKMARQT